jgi:3,4-dihydroxy 2-butanone 4-phosphate synthase/GTP cyclohydrolase II
MTNNPDKVAALEKYGIRVIARVPLKITPHAENKMYLATKFKKFDHFE